MIAKLAEIESDTLMAFSAWPDELTLNGDPNRVRLSIHETLPNVNAEEYKLLYLPTMLGVYTARHQKMPRSDESLREHVFGTGGHPGCDACREETEFLVAHQKKFF